MRIPDRRFIRTTAIVGLGNTAGRFIAFLFMVLVARILSEEEFGEVRYVLSVATLASVIIAAGLPSAMTRFLAKHSTNKRKKDVYFTNTLFIFLIFLIVTELASFAIFFNHIIVLLVILGYSVPLLYMGIIRGLMHYTKFALMSFLRNLMKFALLGLIVVFSVINSTYILLIYAFGGWLAMAILEIYSPSKLSFVRKYISTEAMKEITRFSIPVFITTFAFSLITQSPTIVLARIMGYKYVGIYATANTFTLIYTFVPYAILTISMPKIASTGSRNKRMKVFVMSSSLIILTGALLFIATIIFGRWGLELIFDSKYNDAYAPLVILSGGAILMGIRNAYSALWEGGGRPEFSTYDTVLGGLVSLSASYLLIPVYGVNGAAYSFVLGCLAAVILSTLFLFMFKRGRIELR